MPEVNETKYKIVTITANIVTITGFGAGNEVFALNWAIDRLHDEIIAALEEPGDEISVVD